ncbi:DUF6527 family protein [Microbacterium sp.]|uniref:DUF6527 family protein n=1 Tax=Microbacterium sp. TaxID=51671 RepID=UPI003426C1A6
MDLLNRFRYWRRWKVVLHVDSVDDVPTRLRHRQAAIVGTSHQKWLAFDCPCGNGHRVLLNLDKSHYPQWRIASELPLTLIPSVDEESAAGHCHYIVRNGRIRWVQRKARR